MTEPDNILLTYMRRFDERQERIADDVKDVKHRLTALEDGMGRLQLAIAGINGRMDRFEVRLDRIERRLDLASVS